MPSPVTTRVEVPSPDSDRYLSLRALATYSGLSVRNLRDQLTDRDHPLPHFKVGGKILVRQREFDAWMLRFRVTAPASTYEQDLDAFCADFR